MAGNIIFILSKNKKLIEEVQALLPNKRIFTFSTYKSLEEVADVQISLMIIDENFSKIKQKKSYTKMGQPPIIAIIKNLPNNKILSLIDLEIEAIILKNSLKEKLSKKVDNILNINKKNKKQNSFNNLGNLVNLYLQSVKKMTLGIELKDILKSILNEMNNRFDFISSEIKLKRKNVNNIDVSHFNRKKEQNNNKFVFNYNDENILLRIFYKEKFNRKELQIFIKVINALIANQDIYNNAMQREKYKYSQEKKELFNSMIISLNHQINNPLSIILLESQIINKKLKKDNGSLFKDKFNNIDKNILRIKNVIDSISRLKIDNPKYIPYIEDKNMISINN